VVLHKVPEYFYIQSGVIPYRIKDGKLQILLITSTRSRKWIIPKGVVEPDMTPQESGAQEAFEEAGVSGDVCENPVGSYQVKKWGGDCTVTLYPMMVTRVYDEWLEDSVRKRKWVKADSVSEKISNSAMREVVQTFVENYKSYVPVLES
jgi:phosphohistidine phosphatase